MRIIFLWPDQGSSLLMYSLRAKCIFYLSWIEAFILLKLLFCLIIEQLQYKYGLILIMWHYHSNVMVLSLNSKLILRIIYWTEQNRTCLRNLPCCDHFYRRRYLADHSGTPQGISAEKRSWIIVSSVWTFTWHLQE